MKKLLLFPILLLPILLNAETYEWCEKSYKEHMKSQRWERLADSARTLVNPNVIYDGSYRKIEYPNGDVPSNVGVCTDVIIRAFRKAFNKDLQKDIHLYLKDQHPDRKLDTNIDHRRVRNLMEYFDDLFDLIGIYNLHPDEYLKGNIIIWDLGGGHLHIGICVEDNMVIHNIGYGQVIEPMFLQDRVIRNYTYRPESLKRAMERLKGKGI